MKRRCGDYLYRANLVCENLINSKKYDADKWFIQYSKVSSEFYNENWKKCFLTSKREYISDEK
jgi:hypothetical protein